MKKTIATFAILIAVYFFYHSFRENRQAQQIEPTTPALVNSDQPQSQANTINNEQRDDHENLVATHTIESIPRKQYPDTRLWPDLMSHYNELKKRFEKGDMEAGYINFDLAEEQSQPIIQRILANSYIYELDR